MTSGVHVHGNRSWKASDRWSSWGGGVVIVDSVLWLSARLVVCERGPGPDRES